jgi:hypothetical protein
MNTQQQAYINGFVKRAADYGFDEREAIELLKKASLAPSGGYDMELFNLEDYGDEDNAYGADLRQIKAPGILNHLKRNAGTYIGAGIGLPLAAFVNSTGPGALPAAVITGGLPLAIGGAIDNVRKNNYMSNQFNDPESMSKILEYADSVRAQKRQK